MKNVYKPMLFQTEMVQGILDDRKTQTRRTKGLELINESPNEWSFYGTTIDAPGLFYYFKKTGNNGVSKCIKCPWNIGDILWVRETFAPAYNQFLYKANERFGKYTNQKWKPSLFMPKEVCRLFLKVKSVKAERLQDISESDAKLEGIKPTWITDNQLETKYKNYINDGIGSNGPIKSFTSLWIKINGAYSWNKNPWVWVIEFEKIDKPADF